MTEGIHVRIQEGVGRDNGEGLAFCLGGREDEVCWEGVEGRGVGGISGGGWVLGATLIVNGVGVEGLEDG